FQAEDGIRDFHVTGVQTCALPIYQCFRTAQHAWRRPANLNVSTRAHRLKLELRIESSHFKYADQRHVKHFSDMLNGGFGYPTFLLLRTHEQRDHSRLLTAFWEFCNRLLRPYLIFRAKGESGWLDGIIC